MRLTKRCHFGITIQGNGDSGCDHVFHLVSVIENDTAWGGGRNRNVGL